MDIEKIARLILYDSNVITSSVMRKYFENNPPSFSDVDLAAIVGNCSAPKDKKIELLSSIASETENTSLKAKIEKWITTTQQESKRKKCQIFFENIFEDHFVNFMTPFAKGDIVKMAGDNLRHGILMDGGMIMSATEQQRRAEMLRRGGVQFPEGMIDYSDVQFRVEWLDENGKFYHEHVNPLCLDYHKPLEDDRDYNALTGAAALVKGDSSASLQAFQMACEDLENIC